MEIIFIGTGSGKTSLQRNHSSFIISERDYNILIDCGDGISKALMQQNIEINSINSLIITHLHADHYSGTASLITQMKLLKREKPFAIYIHKNFVNTIRSFINSVYMFSETLGFNLEVIGFDFDETIWLTEDISLTPNQNSHISQKEETKNYPAEMFYSSSLLLNCGKQRIFYTADIGSSEDLYLFNEGPINLMITECSHVSPAEIFKTYKKINPVRLLITHIADETESELLDWYKSLYIDDQMRIDLCHDGLSIQTNID